METEKIIEKAANLSIDQINDLDELLCQAIRSYASRKLMDYDENHPYIFDNKEYGFIIPHCIDQAYFGCSDSLKPHVQSIYQQSNGSGLIFIHFEDVEDSDNDTELGEFSLDDQLFLINLLK